MPPGKNIAKKKAKTAKMEAKAARQSAHYVAKGKLGATMSNTIAADRAAKLTKKAAKRKSKGY